MTGQKTGGRQTGTPNKVTKELREQLKNILSAELSELPEMLKNMQPDKRLDIVIKLMPYCMPKIESIEAKYDGKMSDWLDFN